MKQLSAEADGQKRLRKAVNRAAFTFVLFFQRTPPFKVDCRHMADV